MNLQGFKGDMYNYNQIMRMERNMKFICKVCNKPDVSWYTVNDYSCVQQNDGSEYVIGLFRMNGPRYIIENDCLVLKPKAIVVCSLECKKKYMVEFGHLFCGWLMEGVGAPEGIPMAASVGALSNNHEDASGVSNFKKLETIVDNIDSKQGFYLSGTPGCGKSTLAKALALEYRKRGSFVKWISYEELQEALEGNQNYDVLMARLVYRHVRFDYQSRTVKKDDPWGVIIVDDISPDFTPNSQQHIRLKKLFSQWYDKSIKMVFTANVTVEDLCNAVAPMVYSRMQRMVINVTLPSIDYREAASDE
jgi:hypothetical protein